MIQKNTEYIFLIIFTLLLVAGLTYILRKSLDFFIKRNSKKLHADPTNFIFLKNSISFVVYSIGLIWVFQKIPYFNSLGTALFASAGVLAAAIGFASQKAIANIIGGLFILMFRPFRVGDTIQISNGHKGVVEEITIRHTIIKDFEFRRVVVPNSIMSEDIIVNSSITDKKIRKFVDIGIAYDADLDKAEEIIRNEILQHPYYIDARTNGEKKNGIDPVQIKVVSLGDFAVTLRAFVWTKDFDDSQNLTWDVLRSIKKAFDKNHIEIPFPHRTVMFKNKMPIQNDKE